MYESPVRQAPHAPDPHSQCRTLSLSNIPHDGYVLYEDSDVFLRAGDRTVAGDGRKCALCSVLLWSLGSQLRVRKMEDSCVVLYRNPPDESLPLQRLEVIIVRRVHREGLGWGLDSGGRWYIGPPDPKPWLARGHLTVYAAHGNFTTRFLFKYRKPEANAQSQQCLDLAVQWLKDCEENHGPTCRLPPADSRLPTRLIDVGSSSDGALQLPRLVCATQGRRGRYVALSYCWGAKPFLTLNSANRDIFEREITLDDLPRTIQDAIVVTRRLSIRYLWVDSLCIIQGQNTEAVDDWEMESQKMHQVFRDAYFTLMASGSSDAHEGLFLKRRGQDRFCELPIIPGHCDRSNIAYLGPDPSERSFLDETLHRRGWVYQEAFLSIRALSFGTSELSWRCRGIERRETLIDIVNLAEGRSRLTLTRHTVNRCRPLRCLCTRHGDTPMPTAPAYDDPAEIRKNWIPIVEEYSSKDLSRATDKLPAIAGLATLGSASRGGYLFGLWEDRLTQLLLWRRQTPVSMSNDGMPNSSYEPVRYCGAPSWSWASAEGKVSFLPGADPAYIHIKPFDRKRGSLLVKGYIQRMSTLRLKAAGSYYSGYDNFLPWARYPSSMKTFLDDPDAVPARHRLTVSDEPAQLVDVWFLYLGESCGLILTQEVCGDNYINYQSSVMERICMNVISFRRPFQRLGTFLGWHKKNIMRTQLLLV